MPDDKPTRDEIINTLKALPGVNHLQKIDHDFFSASTGEYRRAIVWFDSTDNLSIEEHRSAVTLAEAVAALTPPDDGPVNREWVEGLKFLRGRKMGMGKYCMIIVPPKDPACHCEIGVKFGANGVLLETYMTVSGIYIPLTPPQTKPAFLSILKLFGVEVTG